MPNALLGLLSMNTQSSWTDALIALPASFVAGQLLAWLYEATYTGLSYSRKFADMLTLLTCISAMFVLIARQSLVAGLGLMAVVSLVRFRANVKAPTDLVFIMAAATFGLGTGLMALAISAVGFLAFAAFALFLGSDSMGSRRRFDGILRLRVASGESNPEALEQILDKHCARSVLLSTSELAQGEFVEHSYQIKFGSTEGRHQLLTDLRNAGQVRDARLLMQEINLEY